MTINDEDEEVEKNQEEEGEEEKHQDSNDEQMKLGKEIFINDKEDGIELTLTNNDNVNGTVHGFDERKKRSEEDFDERLEIKSELFEGLENMSKLLVDIDNSSENRSEGVEEQLSDSVNEPAASTKLVFSEMMSKEKLDCEINRYNLRKGMQKKKDQQFEKQHYNYLNYATTSRGKRRRLNKINNKIYAQNAEEEMNKMRKHEKYCRNKLHQNLVGMFMTQMSSHMGIKVYDDKALTAMAKEYSQLDELSVFKPRHRYKLSKQERESTLNVIDLIKEKRCGRIKGRTVVDGRGHWHLPWKPLLLP